MWLWLLACAAEGPAVRSADAGGDRGAPSEASGGDPTPNDDTDTGGDSGPGGTEDTAPAGPCPAEMALAGTVCVDRWEAYIEGHSPYEVPSGGVANAASGAMPQGYISGDVAAIACENAGKRLCTREEWERACGGPRGTTWPYGDTYDPDACNDTRSSHPVVDYFGDDDVWDMEHMNDPGINQQPDTEDASGANPDCVTAEGHYDMHGNLHEWVADPDGTFKGGFYADAEINGDGCTYTTTAHATSYHDYSIGFRCCREPDGAAARRVGAPG